ncbi:MAG: tyrosine-type recombinase/integrase, partial [Clostridia bacterium]
MKKDNYFDNRNYLATEKLRAIRKELPNICNEFFVGIESRTSALTRLGYAEDLKVFFYFLTTEINGFIGMNVAAIDFPALERITTTNIESFLEYLSHYKYNGKILSNSLKTKARKLTSIRSFFKYNFNKNNIDCDNASKVLTPKLHDKAIIRLDGDEVDDLLASVEGGKCFETNKQNAYSERTALRDQAILTLFLGTGIRISELVGLNIDDIDFKKNQFLVTRKGGNQSILYFSDEIAVALLSYLEERERKNLIEDYPAMFLSLQKNRICVRAVENLVKKYAKVVTPLKNITPHKLRSTYGT